VSPYRSFWIPEEFVRIYNRFKWILKREGKSVGAHLREHIIKYVDVHDPGNPQARLTSYAEGGPVDLASIEGQVREYFRTRDSKGFSIYFRDIAARCREKVSDKKAALAMAERTARWLHGRGVKVWR